MGKHLSIKRQSHKNDFDVGIPTLQVGSSSLLMIFVVLCLVSFATLSIVSSLADRRLSQKVVQHTTAYYTACNQAEAKLAQIDDTLHSLYHECSTQNEYYKEAGETIRFAIPVTDIHTLDIAIKVLYPENDNDIFYELLSYQLTPTGTLELDESLPVYR